MDFNEKVVLVTGASRGIGLALTQRFLREGCRVHGISRSFPESYLESFPEEDRARLELHPCDLSVQDQRNALIQKFVSQGGVNILVNNAGVLTGDLLHELDPDAIETCIQVNLLATLQLTRGLLPQMLKNNEGLIINNASVSAEFYFPGAQVYAASKAGVSLFTKSLAMELKKTKVRTLLLLTPGVQTQMYEEVEKKYSSFLNLDFLEAIPAEAWIERVFLSIKKKHNICHPQGKTRVGLFLNRHFPNFYEKSLETLMKPKELS